MGLYTESIKKRIKNDEEAVRKIDAQILGSFQNVKYTEEDRLYHLRRIVDYALEKYGMSSDFDGSAEDEDEMLECIFEPLGIMYEKIDMSDSSWKDITGHIICFLEDGTPILVFNKLGGHRYISSLNGKKKRFSSSTKITGVGYAVYRPLDGKGFGFSEFIKYVFRIIPPKFWIVIVLLSALAAVINLVIPEVNRLVLKEWVPAGYSAVHFIIGGIIIYAGAGLLCSLINAAKKYAVELYKLRITKQTQIAIIARILNMPISFFRKNLSGHIATYVKNARELSNIIVGMVFCTSITLMFSLINIPQMIYMSGPLAIAGISILVLRVAFMAFSAGVSAKYLKLNMDTESELRSNMFTSFKGIQKIKTAGAESRIYVKWAGIFKKNIEYSFDPPFSAKLSTIIIPTLSTFVFYLVAWLCKVPAADFIAFTASYSIMSAAVSEASNLFNASYTAKQYVNHIGKLFMEDTELQDNRKIMKKLKGSVKFKDVNFSYNPNDPFKIEDLNLSVAAGETVGITGRSGCGKSTLLNMIVGINKPAAGNILIDNYPVETLNMHFVNKRIGFVTQYSRLLPGTIRFNITMGNNDISDEDVWEALEKAQIKDLVEGLPDGLDSVVSETSSGGFSGGQKQCMLLARAFVRKPKLMILDEATSALDNNTQAAVLKEIYGLKATVIMVAHRLTTIRKCDRIVVLENGTIKEEGTYEQLMDNHGLFEQLVLSQEKQ